MFNVAGRTGISIGRGVSVLSPLCALLTLALLAGCQSTGLAGLREANARASLAWDGKSRSTAVPFTLVDNHIVIPVSVNGGAPLDFILDSGAGASLLFDSRQTRELALTTGDAIELAGAGGAPAASVPVATGLDLAVGSLRASGLSLAYLPIGSVPFFDSVDDAYVDGVIGGVFFERFLVTIDYDDGVVMFAEPDAAAPLPESGAGGWESLPIEAADGLVYLRASVGDRERRSTPVKLRVDTGYRGLMALSPATSERLEPPADYFPTRSRDLSGEHVGRVGVVPWLKLGSFRLLGLPAEFRLGGDPPRDGANGVLGNELLNRFNLRFDYGGQRLYLAPNHRYRAPMTADRSGLQIRAHSAGGVVERVAPGSAGAAAGLSVGDVITSFDGTPATPETLTLLKRELASERDSVNLCWRSRVECRCADLALASRFRRDQDR